MTPHCNINHFIITLLIFQCFSEFPLLVSRLYYIQNENYFTGFPLTISLFAGILQDQKELAQKKDSDIWKHLKYLLEKKQYR